MENKPRNWAGIKPTNEQIKTILADHETWVKEEEAKPKEDQFKTTPPHNLEKAVLQDAHLSGANLKKAVLWGANLQKADLRYAKLQEAFLVNTKLQKANLVNANLQEADLVNAKLQEADLSLANLQGADLGLANLQGADLGLANLQEAGLVNAKLQEAGLMGANLQEANLRYANLQEANLRYADLRGADLRSANLSEANVTGVKYNRAMKCRGIRAETCFGSPMFRRHVQDLDYLEEFRSKRLRWPVYALWLLLADCGRSFWFWAAWSVAFAFLFACLFTPYPDGFAGYPAWTAWCGEQTHALWQWSCQAWQSLCGLLPDSVTGLFRTACGPIEFTHTAAVYGKTNQPVNFGSALYFSIVTFTTLGFGDVVAATRTARILVGLEVITGYIMLGGLISILANKLARRS